MVELLLSSEQPSNQTAQRSEYPPDKSARVQFSSSVSSSTHQIRFSSRARGSLGVDILFGNMGADMFIFKNLAESTSAAPDMIGDFRHVQSDIINLRGIDAKSLTQTNDAFHFIGNQADFTHRAGELRFDKDQHLLQGDVDGDGQADFAIHLNVDHLVKGDFVL